MARGRKPKAPKPLEGADEFLGDDPEKEAIEKIAAAKEAAATEAKGDNGGPPMDEAAWRRAALESVAEDIEIEDLQEQIAECRGRLSSIRKVAQSCGVDWDVVKIYRKDAKRIRNGEMGAMVTEERRYRWLLKVMASPLSTQFSLWDYAEDAGGAPAGAKPEMEAELQGQHSYSQGAALTDNPFHAVTDTERHNEWRHGWVQAQNANARSMAPNGTAEAAH